MLIKRKVRFLLHKRQANDVKNVAIRMRVTLRGQKPIDFPTGVKVDVDEWDTQTEYAKDKAKDAGQINRLIDDYKVKINEIFARYELIEKRVPTPQEIKDLFNDMTGRASLADQIKAHDFWHVYNLFITQESKKNQWTISTYEKFKILKKHLQAFDPSLSFSTLTEKTLYGFVDFFNRKQYLNTTIYSLLKVFLHFIRWAARYEYYHGKAHQTFKPKFKGISPASKEIIYLSKTELKQLQEHVFTPDEKHLERVRDVFLFQCFTGLRYSDVAKLKRVDIKNDVIHVVTKKTSVSLQIELNKHSRAILDKYKEVQFANGSPLPVVVSTSMNKSLKK